MIETDYINGQLLVKRGDKVEHSFTFSEFVSAEDFKPINKLRNDLMAISSGKKDVTQKEVEALEKKFYVELTTKSFSNPMPLAEALKKLTIAEMGSLSEEILIFLANWSSISEVKQYALQLSETNKKETKA